ncbi:MAG TPA: pirin family protein [Usitatibacter sp.]|nr:pirin family protein [Usitatibacter sp.]
MTAALATFPAATAARAVEHISVAHVAPVGTFTVRRALPFSERHSVGPWVFLDHFGPFRVKPGEDGVGPHPHAGIETVTYLLSGRNEHRDSAGHTGIVSAGGAQWMTAGGGIVHAERPLAENESELTMHGIQLWTSLPRLAKTMAPRYQRIDAQAIAEVPIDRGRVRVIAGEYAGRAGPAQTLMPTFLWHVSLQPGAAFSSALPAGYEAGVYVISGAARFGPTVTRTGELAVVATTGEPLGFENAGDEALEALALGGAPAEGPLVFHGPFVMNTVDQVRAAEIAYRTGRMGHLDP